MLEDDNTSHQKQGKGWGVCMNRPERTPHPESMFCVLLRAFNMPSTVLQAFPTNWQAAWLGNRLHSSLILLQSVFSTYCAPGTELGTRNRKFNAKQACPPGAHGEGASRLNRWFQCSLIRTSQRLSIELTFVLTCLVKVRGSFMESVCKGRPERWAAISWGCRGREWKTVL